MVYTVTAIPNFEKQFKRLCKKYPSLFEDVGRFIEILSKDPIQGTPLGSNLYKVRLAISSKFQGKSGGARIITCVRIVEGQALLVAIYDKSEQGTMTVKELRKFLE